MASSKGNSSQPLACPLCGARSLFIVALEDFLYLECLKGHGSRKYYGRQKESAPKPKYIVRRLEDMFTAEQKRLFSRVTAVINETDGFARLPVHEQIKFLCAKCRCTEKEIYQLCKLITVFQNASGGGIKNGNKNLPR